MNNIRIKGFHKFIIFKVFIIFTFIYTCSKFKSCLRIVSALKEKELFI